MKIMVGHPCPHAHGGEQTKKGIAMYKHSLHGQKPLSVDGALVPDRDQAKRSWVLHFLQCKPTASFHAFYCLSKITQVTSSGLFSQTSERSSRAAATVVSGQGKDFSSLHRLPHPPHDSKFQFFVGNIKLFSGFVNTSCDTFIPVLYTACQQCHWESERRVFNAANLFACVIRLVN